MELNINLPAYFKEHYGADDEDEDESEDEDE